MKNTFLILIYFILLIRRADAEEASREVAIPTLEDLSWSIPPDDWYYKDKFLLKGKYFKINSSVEEVKENLDGSQIRKLNVFSDPELKNLLIGVSQGVIYDPKNSVVCEFIYPQKKIFSRKFYYCQDGGCKKEVSSTENDVSPLLDLSKVVRKSDNDKCHFKIDYTYVPDPSNLDGSIVGMFRYNLIESKKYVEIAVNGKPAYLDIRNCQSSKKYSTCEIVNFENSVFEKNLLNLRNVQKEKSHKNLNRAIELILPCVKKRDIKCVQKFLSNREDEGPDFYETQITEEVFKELESCLNYEKLLPHLLATKGTRMSCIFNGDDSSKPLRGVTFIEALSSKGIKVNF